ncbi:hypothetical protein BC940DRAFT_309551 [Gongronella butleri]|nr:hypothetical protein BC940DRAFT_309551 [Gongronella butleri]
MAALPNVLLGALILQSLVISYGVELMYRNLIQLRIESFAGKASNTRTVKALMGFFMSVKTGFFLSFNTYQGDRCYVIARIADICYQLSMAAGTYVLMSRVHSIVSLEWKTASKYSMRIAVAARIIIGILDTVYLNVAVLDDGSCFYEDNYYTGPIYTFADLLIDLYVTIMVTYILVSHIRQLEKAHVPVDTRLYIGIVSQNVIRTVSLSIVNLMSVVFLLLKLSSDAIMLIWPIINIFVVLLIGYDSDVAKTIIHLQESYWKRVNELLSSATVGTPLMESLPGGGRKASIFHKDSKSRSTPDLPLRSLAPAHMHPTATQAPASDQHGGSSLSPPPATLQQQHYHP